MQQASSSLGSTSRPVGVADQADGDVHVVILGHVVQVVIDAERTFTVRIGGELIAGSLHKNGGEGPPAIRPRVGLDDGPARPEEIASARS